MRKKFEAQVRVKAGPDDGLEAGEFTAYASTFTREPDSYGDIVAKGAFADTLTAWADSGNVLPVLYGHRMDDPKYNLGGVKSAAEDDHGLLVTGTLDLDNPTAAQVYKLMKGRRISQMSFAFDTVSSGEVTLPDGRKANELREVKLYEVSIVPIGANQDTEIVAVKDGTKAGRKLSATNEAELRKALTDAESGCERIRLVLASLGDDTAPDGNGDEASGKPDPADEDTKSVEGEGGKAVKPEDTFGVKSGDGPGYSSALAALEIELLSI